MSQERALFVATALAAALALGAVGAVAALIATAPSLAPLGEEEAPRAEAPRAQAPPDAAGSPRDGGAPDAGPYPLDGLPRTTDTGCPDLPLVERTGAWRPALRIHPAFLPAVEEIERVLADTSREIYGAAPSALLSASSYRCTPVRGRPERLSEHGLGNALDVRGIELDLPEGRRAVTVREGFGHGGPDARFFRRVVERLAASGRVTGILGPPDPDHLDHLHFDHGRSRFLSVVLDP